MFLTIYLCLIHFLLGAAMGMLAVQWQFMHECEDSEAAL